MEPMDMISMLFTIGILILVYMFRNRLAMNGVILDIRYWFFQRKVWWERKKNPEQFQRVKEHDPWLQKKWERAQKTQEV